MYQYMYYKIKKSQISYRSLFLCPSQLLNDCIKSKASHPHNSVIPCILLAVRNHLLTIARSPDDFVCVCVQCNQYPSNYSIVIDSSDWKLVLLALLKNFYRLCLFFWALSLAFHTFSPFHFKTILVSGFLQVVSRVSKVDSLLGDVNNKRIKQEYSSIM